MRMKMQKLEILQDPQLIRLATEIAELKKKEKEIAKKVAEELSAVAADIGDRLIAAKEALDKTSDNATWLVWLKRNFRKDERVAQDYMAVARWRAKNPNTYSDFFDVHVSCLFRLARVPENIMSVLQRLLEAR